jgi:hypothetical protein
MPERAANAADYEPPAIDAREPIALPLIGTAISPPPQSAAFRPERVEAYVAPRIVERVAVAGPLVAFGSPPPPPP